MEDNILDIDTLETEDIKKESLLSLNQFIILCICTLGLYELWWTYKAWKHFELKENLDINSIGRTIFLIFFQYELYQKIKRYSQEVNYQIDFQSGYLVFGLIVSNLLGKLPEPFWLISIVSFIFLIPPFKAFNFYKLNSSDIKAEIQERFNSKQIALIIVGSIFWALIFLGLTSEA